MLPVFGALARLGYDDARHVWFGITMAFLALSVGVAVAVTPGRRLEVLTAAVLLTMCSYPLLFHVHQGQIDLIVAALSVSAFLLYPRWQGWPAAALMALAILIKVTPVLLLAAMVLYFRDIRFLLKTLACLAAGLALSLLTRLPPPVRRVRQGHPAADLRLVAKPVQPDPRALLVELAGRRQAGLRVRLCRPPVPGVRRRQEQRAAA